jgi:hypothetical protein
VVLPRGERSESSARNTVIKDHMRTSHAMTQICDFWCVFGGGEGEGGEGIEPQVDVRRLILPEEVKAWP